MRVLCRTEDGKNVEFIWVLDTDEVAESVKEVNCIYVPILFSSYPSPATKTPIFGLILRRDECNSDVFYRCGFV